MPLPEHAIDYAVSGELIHNPSVGWPDTKLHIVHVRRDKGGEVSYVAWCGKTMQGNAWERSPTQNKATYYTCESCYFRYRKR